MRPRERSTNHGGFRRAVALVLLLSTGCSWITVQSPPSRPVSRDEPLSCTTSVAAPVVDTVLGSAALGAGGLATGAGIAGLASCDASTCWIAEPLALTYLGFGVLLLGVAVAEGFSAAHGYQATATCRELETARLACVSGVEPSCRPPDLRVAMP